MDHPLIGLRYCNNWKGLTIISVRYATEAVVVADMPFFGAWSIKGSYNANLFSYKKVRRLCARRFYGNNINHTKLEE